jgi:hypothetical protein
MWTEIMVWLTWAILIQNTTESFAQYDITKYNIVFSCDYNKSLAALQVFENEVPCSRQYTPITHESGLKDTKSLVIIPDTNRLKPIEGHSCFKLKLSTTCVYKVFSSNIITRSYETITFTRSECISLSGCIHCTVAEQYPDPDCSGFSSNTKSKTVLFQSKVIGYGNGFGEYLYGNMSSQEPMFLIGGSYNEEIHFLHMNEVYTTSMSFLINNQTLQLLSIENKILLNWLGTKKNIIDKVWLVYSENYYVLASQLPDPKTQGQQMNQTYADMFFGAQLNITQWNIDYISCRIKNIVLKLFDKYGASDMLDLDIGEKYSDGFLKKYACSTKNEGSLINNSSCIYYINEGYGGYVDKRGEISQNKSTCGRSLRINRTSVLKADSMNGLFIEEYSFPSIREEENILYSPPSMINDRDEWQRLILSSQITKTTTLTNQTSTYNTKNEASKFGLVEIGILILILLLIVGSIVIIYKRYNKDEVTTTVQPIIQTIPVYSERELRSEARKNIINI